MMFMNAFSSHTESSVASSFFCLSLLEICESLAHETRSEDASSSYM